MKHTLGPAEWLKHLRDLDRLPAFLTEGGSVVRVGVTDSRSDHEHLASSLEMLASAEGCRLLPVSHETCSSLSNPQRIVSSLVPALQLRDLFGNIARRVWAEREVKANDYSLEAALAASPGATVASLRSRYDAALSSMLPPGKVLNHEFTRAVSHVATNMIEGHQHALEAIGLFESYLLGTATQRELVPLGVLRRLTRSNATPTLQQLTALNRVGGWPATILHLDLRWACDHRSLEGLAQAGPTRASRRDLYQWVRELIDLAPSFTSTFIAVEFGPTFLDPNPAGNGFGSYDALRLRLDDGVKPAGGPNPSAALVHLGAS